MEGFHLLQRKSLHNESSAGYGKVRCRCLVLFVSMNQIKRGQSFDCKVAMIGLSRNNFRMRYRRDREVYPNRNSSLFTRIIQRSNPPGESCARSYVKFP